MGWKWAKADELELVRFVNEEAINWLDKLPIENRIQQMQDSTGRRNVLKAIYDALIQKNIQYAYEKYLPEEETQIIRTPVEILTTPGEGTCLDLALLFCSICFGYDLLPLLILFKKHAFAAVSLKYNRKDCQLLVSERTMFTDNDSLLFQNLDELIKLVNDGAYIAVECTGFAHAKKFGNVDSPEAQQRTSAGVLDFDRAVEAGREHFNKPFPEFIFAIDIASAQDKSKIQPYEIPKNESKIPKLLSSPPFVPEIFEGRDNDLQAVKQKLFSDNNILLLNGEGGIGKTSLAAKYWDCFKADYHHVAWIFAQHQLLDALLTLAVPLKVDFPEAMPAQERLNLLLITMAKLDTPCLLIIDNINDVRELEQHYLALRNCTNFHVLLTTRITQFEQVQTYLIKPLQEEDALRVFKIHYPNHRQDEDELLKKIRIAVGGNTLVLELLAKNLAAINIDECFYSLSNLLQDLQKNGLLELPQTEAVRVAEKGNHPTLKKALPSEIISALYDEMEMVVPLTEEEKKLLSNLAVLPPENLPYRLLKILLTPEDTRAFSKTLMDLSQRGWLERSGQKDNSSTFYKISPVVQEITRHKNRDKLLGDCTTMINNLIKKLDYQDGTGHFLNASYEEAALFCRYAEAITHCLQEKTNFMLGKLYDHIGNYYNTTSNQDNALRWYEQSCCLLKKIHEADPDNVEVNVYFVATNQFLCDILLNLGKFNEAFGQGEEFHRLAKELYEAYPDDEKNKVLFAISCQFLGNTTTKHLEKFECYQDFYRLTQDLHKAHPDNVKFKHDLAIAYGKLGNTTLNIYEEAQGLLNELYEDYPDKVALKNYLAIDNMNLGNTDTNPIDILDYYKDFQRLAQDLHKAYPDNFGVIKNLKNDLIRLGKTALVFYEDAFLLLKKLYKAYPENLEYKKNLALIYRCLGNTTNKLGDLHCSWLMYLEFHRLSKELHEDNPINIDFKGILAESCGLLGAAASHPDEAWHYYEECLRLEQELYDASPDTVTFKNGLAIANLRLGDYYEYINAKINAIHYYSQSKLLLEQLVTSYPLNKGYIGNLRIAETRLGILKESCKIGQ